MTSPKSRRPGDLILDRYLPDADQEMREQARDVLRTHALILIRIGERIEVEMAQAGDSPDSGGRLTIEASDP